MTDRRENMKLSYRVVPLVAIYVSECFGVIITVNRPIFDHGKQKKIFGVEVLGFPEPRVCSAEAKRRTERDKSVETHLVRRTTRF